MTSEPEGLTEKWIEQHDVKYAYAYDKGGKLSRELGVSGIPHAFLMNPTGEIVWRGHPGNLQAGMIEPHLAGALSLPIGNWPDELSRAKKALLKNQYAKAIDAVDKLLEEDQSVAKYRDVILSMLDTKIAAMNDSLEMGDFLGARDAGKLLKKELKGLPGADRADEVLKLISKDRDAKAIISAQKTLVRLKGARIKKKTEALGIVRQAERLVKKHPGTFVETQALNLIAEVEALARNLK